MRIKATASINVALTTSILMVLAGCSDGKAVPGAPATTATSTSSYVLVTEARPEAPEKYLAIQRTTYDLCAEALRHRQLVPKPFPAVPSALVTVRTTYASDGKRTVVREVTHTLDFAGGQVEGACEMRWLTTANVAVTGDGQEQTAQTDESGKVQVDPPVPLPAESVRAATLAAYATSKIVNGVRLKCRDADTCIVDPAVVLVARRTDPVEAVSRADPIAPFNTPILVKPVSLTVGKQVDPALFALDSTK